MCESRIMIRAQFEISASRLSIASAALIDAIETAQKPAGAGVGALAHEQMVNVRIDGLVPAVVAGDHRLMLRADDEYIAGAIRSQRRWRVSRADDGIEIIMINLRPALPAVGALSHYPIA